MNNNYITQSQNHANSARETYEQSLSGLIDGLNNAKKTDQELANQRYQNMINKIEQQIPGIQQKFEENAKAAYINKQQNLQQINADLNRLGVNTQGFGVTQRLMNETAYGNVYGNLAINLNEQMQDVENQKTNALGDLNEDLAGIDAEYAKNKLNLDKYIKERGQAEYDKEYDRFYDDLKYKDQMKQQELENQLAEKKYQEALKQQEWENAFKEKQRADALKQQEFKNALAQRELDIERNRLNETIRHNRIMETKQPKSSSGSSKEKDKEKKDDPILNDNKCLWLGSGKKAQAEYDSLMNTIFNNGGIKRSQLEEYLNAAKQNKVFSDSDIKKIREQFNLD